MQSVNELCEKGNSLSESTIWYGYCKIVYYPANTACYLEELCYWGMAQAMGDSFSSAVAVSVFLLIVLNLGIIYWLSRHNPAANPQSK